MSRRFSAAVLRDFSSLWSDGSLAGLTDAELVARCLQGESTSDGPAFAALVSRHGPLVLGTCRRLLSDPHDIEDAFQATFLVLLRKLPQVRTAGSLGPWMYAVAYRVAARVRTSSARHRVVGLGAVEPAIEPGTNDVESDDLRRKLHEEIGRLPARYQAPVVLCHLQGKSHEEAARILQWPVGTVSGRLSRARDLLRRRLHGRGGFVPAAALLALLETELLAAGSASLIDAASRIAARIGTGPAPASAGAVARRVAARASLNAWVRSLAVVTIVAGTVAAAVFWGIVHKPELPPPPGPESTSSRSAAVDRVVVEEPLVMPPALSLESQRLLAEIAAEVDILEARQRVVREALKKKGEELELARLESLAKADPATKSDPQALKLADREGKLERLSAELEWLKAECADISARYKYRNGEGMDLETILVRKIGASKR